MPFATRVNHSTTTGPGPLGEAPDPHERLSADDQATLRESQFLEASLSAVREAAAAPAAPRGRCLNCQAQCLPLATYCDEDCQADHERRLQTLRRQGRGR